MAIAVCEQSFRALCVAGDRARRGEPALHRGPMQVVVDFLQRLDRAARVALVVRAPARCVRRPAPALRGARARPSHRRDRCGPCELRRRRCRRRRVPDRTDRRCRAACHARLPSRRLAAEIATSCRRISLFASRSRICSGQLLRAGNVAGTQLDRGDLRERCALLPLRFDSVRRLARAGEIFGRDLREHDVVQHPIAKCRLADLRDCGERLVNRAVAGGRRRSASARARCWRAFRHVDRDRRWFRRRRARARARGHAIGDGSSTDWARRKRAVAKAH